MTTNPFSLDPLLLDEKADLQTVLAAWHNATLRLEQTHEALRQEVRELTGELEAKNRELARKNRLADLGQMASHVAHEVRNNLVPVTLYLSLLRRRISDDPGSLDVLDKITAGFTALDVMVNDLLHFTSDRDPRLQTFPLGTLIDDVCAALAAQFSAQAIRNGHRRAAEPGRHRRPRHAPPRRAQHGAQRDGRHARRRDPGRSPPARRPEAWNWRSPTAGRGCREKVLPRIFEPFFTTKQNGTGLGLAMVARIAEVHGGEATAANCPQGGAAFTLRIPHLVREAAA